MQTIATYAQAVNVAQSGALLVALAYVLRHFSTDDAADWWKFIVIFILSMGLTLATVGTLLAIWSA